jgi:hypothetical protein
MQYASLKPRGTGAKGRPPDAEGILELQIRLAGELKRAESAANAGLKRLSKMRNDTSLKKDKVTKAVNLGQTDVVVDFSGGGGDQAVIAPPVKIPPTLPTALVTHGLDDDAKVRPNPLHTGTRADRAAARAYANADAKPADSLLNNLTAREYNTRTRAHAR